MNSKLLDKSFKYIHFYITIRDISLYNDNTISYIQSLLKIGTEFLLKRQKQHHEYLFHIMLEDDLPKNIIKSNNKVDPLFVYGMFQNQVLKFDSLSHVTKLMIDCEIIVAHIKLRMLLH